jgi:hypothetical protein
MYFTTEHTEVSELEVVKRDVKAPPIPLTNNH